MKIDKRSERANKQRERRLRRKLGKFLPKEDIDNCENLSHLESKRKTMDSLKNMARKSRAREKNDLIKFIEESDGVKLTSI